jgi:hypothetical protein
MFQRQEENQNEQEKWNEEIAKAGIPSKLPISLSLIWVSILLK